MDLMLGNLAFSLVTGAALPVLVASLVLWLVWRHLRRNDMLPDEPVRGRAKSVLVGIVLLLGIILAVNAVSNSGPRITVQDANPARDVNPYQAGEVRNLDPNVKTDDERLEENRRLIQENSLGDGG